MMQTFRVGCSFCHKFARLTLADSIIPTLHYVNVRHMKSKRKAYERSVKKELYERRIAQGPEPERPRSIWPNWNYDAELYSFGQRLGEEFTDNTLRKIFTHRSYIESEELRRQELLSEDTPVSLNLQDNTDLVHTGEETITEFIKASLRSQFPVLPEESIRSVCAYLTSDEMLCYVGQHVGVKDLILTQEFPASTETVCRTFKAVVGGLCEDQGKVRAYKFVQDFVLTQLADKDINELLGITNPMGLLSGILAQQGRGAPEPRLMYQSGGQTVVAVYMVGVYSDRELIGKSYGETTSIAEEMAARDALRTIFGTTNHRTPFKYHQPIQLQDTNFKENLSLNEYMKYAELSC